jgi:fermentation-respiration switch protein FrsA (DUF1100 family)
MAATVAAPIASRRRSLGGWLLWLGRRLAILYFGVLLVLLLLENWLVYHPAPAQSVQPPPGAEDLFLTTADGVRIHARWFPRSDAALALLYCHGNAGNLEHRTEAIRDLQKGLGVSVLIFDYPGYGKSTGKVSEAGCYAAADAACDWLAGRMPPERIVLFGKSLGGGVAVELAARRPHHSLVLMKTFTSLPDVGQVAIPWLPARWLMRNRFDNRAKIGRCKRPIFVAHGDHDELVPFSLGQRLYEAAPEPKQFYLMDGTGHNDAIPPGCLAALADFLQRVN